MKYYIGNIKKWQKEKGGWFFGQFIEDPLLHSENIEVAWKKFDKEFSDKPHFHKQGTEINIDLSGESQVEIDNKIITLKRGDFLIVYPNTVFRDVFVAESTEMIIVKFPSVANDKFR